MRWSSLIFAVAMLALCWSPRPASAQAAGEEVTLINQVIEVLPTSDVEPGEAGHCFLADAGTLTAHVQAVGAVENGRVAFRLGVSENVDDQRMRAEVGPQPSVYEIPARKAVYCFQLESLSRAPGGIIAIGGTRPLAQYVRLRLIWTP
ncbi:MAG: hypothetical protein ACKVVP_18095 [Chloroflexota bacterium]